MRQVECEFESEALAAALQSRWPDRVDEDLRVHVRTCEICSDVLSVGAMFDDARDDTRAAANTPDSGRVWRLARMRAMREAAAMANAPLTITQMIGFACAFAVAGACFGASCSWFQGALGRVVASLSGDNGRVLVAIAAEHGFAIAGAVLLVFVVPTAVWLTASGE